MECFATEITHCGKTGSGQVTKILNNMVLFQTVVALSEAYAIAMGAGCNPEMLFEALSKGSADSFALRNHGMKAILPREFPRWNWRTIARSTRPARAMSGRCSNARSRLEQASNTSRWLAGF